GSWCGYFCIWLPTCENTLLALVPIRRTVPITITRITASITAYSATSWPPSSVHSRRIACITVRPPVDDSSTLHALRGTLSRRLNNCNNCKILLPTPSTQWHARAENGTIVPSPILQIEIPRRPPRFISGPAPRCEKLGLGPL